MRFSVSTLLFLTALVALIAAASTRQTFLFQLVQTAAWFTVVTQAVDIATGQRNWTLTFLSALNVACLLYLSTQVIGFSPGAMLAGAILGAKISRRNIAFRKRREAKGDV